jgi:hypothetical protein
VLPARRTDPRRKPRGKYGSRRRQSEIPTIRARFAEGKKNLEAGIDSGATAACFRQERAAGIAVDTPCCGFHNRQEVFASLTERQKTLERALEDAVSRALRDNLAPLQRTADELHQAYADLVASCSSSRPTNALPAMLRAQTAASALAAGLSVLSNFVAVALNPRERDGASEAGPQATEGHEGQAQTAVAEPEEEAAAPAAAPAAEPESEWAEEPPLVPVEAEAPTEVATPQAAEARAEAAFDVSSLPQELQELHRRANRVAKVAMQDIKLLRPKDVRLGRENKDVCKRLRSDLDKARKEYDRRFRAILDHPVDYFHRWMVEILAEGDGEALGEYPYPSPVLRH